MVFQWCQWVFNGFGESERWFTKKAKTKKKDFFNKYKGEKIKTDSPGPMLQKWESFQFNIGFATFKSFYTHHLH